MQVEYRDGGVQLAEVRVYSCACLLGILQLHLASMRLISCGQAIRVKAGRLLGKLECYHRQRSSLFRELDVGEAIILEPN